MIIMENSVIIVIKTVEVGCYEYSKEYFNM